MKIQDIHNQYSPAIARYLTRLTGSSDVAEDLTQEVFIKVNNGLGKFKGDSSLSTWIYKIATNIAIDRSRSKFFQKIEKQTVSRDKLENQEWSNIELMSKEEKSPEQQMVNNEMNDCIRSYINRLKENYKTVIWLCDYEGLKNRETAEVLGVSIETVKIRLHRARAKLKEMMNNGCDIYNNHNGEIGCNEK
ncbi:MAG: sigma-70 family RNA polymerase sigma factor [Deltaproteobacteria bacterium]|nr:sigma-70 family RNA polymerase sigma factor [Deltaproteobacteria bacterium]